MQFIYQHTVYIKEGKFNEKCKENKIEGYIFSRPDHSQGLNVFQRNTIFDYLAFVH